MEGGATLHWLDTEQVRTLSDAVCRLPGLSEHRQRELDAWHHPNRARSRDGLPGELPRSFSFFGDPDDNVSIAVLCTDGDRMASWLRAGQSLEALLLSATMSGVRASMHAVDGVRSTLAELMPRTGFPQVLVRFGYSDPPRVTNRRSLVDVMMHPGFAP